MPRDNYLQRYLYVFFLLSIFSAALFEILKVQIKSKNVLVLSRMPTFPEFLFFLFIPLNVCVFFVYVTISYKISTAATEDQESNQKGNEEKIL